MVVNAWKREVSHLTFLQSELEEMLKYSCAFLKFMILWHLISQQELLCSLSYQSKVVLSRSLIGIFLS